MSTQFELAQSHTSRAEGEINSLLVTWQNPQTKRYYLMGTLQKFSSRYQFAYYPDADKVPGFRKIPGFPDIHRTYSSSVLFPLFSSRLMSKKRDDRLEWLQSFDLADDSDEFQVLARSLGRRVGDNFEIFEEPTLDLEKKTLQGTCPLHGLRYKEKGLSLLASGQLKSGQQLNVTVESNNAFDPRARLVSSESETELGYIPRPLLDYVERLGALTGVPEAHIIYLNSEPHEIHQRIQIAYRWHF